MLMLLLGVLSAIVGALSHALYSMSKEEKRTKKLYEEFNKQKVFDSILDTDVLLERSNERLRAAGSSIGGFEPKDPGSESKD